MSGERSFYTLFYNHYLKYSVLFFTLLFVNTHLFSQTKKIDSLNLVLQNAKHDSTRINTLCKMATLISQNNPDTALTLLSKAQKLAEDNVERIPTKIPDEVIILLNKSKKEKVNNSSISAPIGLKYVFLKKLATIYYCIGIQNYEKGNIETSQDFNNKSLNIYKSLKDNGGIANSFYRAGILSFELGHTKEAFDAVKYSLKLYEDEKDFKGKSSATGALAVFYSISGQIKEALDCFLQSIKLDEASGNKQSVAINLSNIANIYGDQGQLTEALKYYDRSLKIYTEIDDKKGISYIYLNMGAVYNDKGELIKALDFYNKGLKLAQELNDKISIINYFSNIGTVYSAKKELKEASNYAQQSLKLSEEINYKEGITKAFINLADISLQRNNLNQALSYSLKGLQLSKELGYPDLVKHSAIALKTIYQKQNNPKKALEMFELYIQMRDSINSEETKRASIKNQLQYQYDKKALADSIKLSDQKKISSSKLMASQAKLKQEKTQRFALYGIAIVLLILAGLLYYNYRVKNRSNQQLTLQKLQIEQKNQQLETQKNSISSQNKLLENKNNQITDSIEYAKKIQETMLPDPTILTNYFADAFIYYQPKDIVSGDFYWFKELPAIIEGGNNSEKGSIALAVADCTGHGVPGALMSVLGHNSLDSAYNQPTNTELKNIITYLDTFFKQKTRTQNMITSNVDGMALSLINYNKQDQLITYTTANHYIYFIRDNQLTELRSNNFSIGSLQNQVVNQGTLGAQKNDMFYLCTDGYADQKGGPQNRKYMTKKLKETFIKIASLPANEQHHILKTEMDAWKGNNSQIDDMLVVGVRI